MRAAHVVPGLESADPHLRAWHHENKTRHVAAERTSINTFGPVSTTNGASEADDQRPP